MTHHDTMPGPWWPADPAAFVDPSRCPACFGPLSAPWCPTCGLDLAVPRANDLMAAGQRLVDDEAERQRIITSMRQEQFQRAQQTAAPPTATAPPASPTVAAATSAPAAAADAPSPSVHGWTTPSQADAPAQRAAVADGSSASPVTAAPPTRASRSGVQITLLSLGIALVSIAAVFFLFLAYLIASLETRVVLTAVLALGVFGTAAYLKHRRLSGTAEGLAALSAALLVIDVWIARGADAWGSSAVHAATFNGVALTLVAGAAYLAWRATRLRTPSIVAFSLLVPGVALWVGGLTTGAGAAFAGWAGLTAGCLVSVVGAFCAYRTESVISRSFGFVLGAFSPVVLVSAVPSSAPAAFGLGAATVVVWLLHAYADRSTSRVSTWQHLAMVGAGLTAAVALFEGIDRLDLPHNPFWVGVATVAAGSVAVLVVRQRSGSAPFRSLLLTAFLALGALPALTGALAGIRLLGAYLRYLASGAEGWYAPTWTPTLDRDDLWTVVVLLVSSALVAMLLGRVRALTPIPLAFLTVGVLGVASALDDVSAGLVCFAAAAIGALAVVTAGRALSRTSRLMVVAAGLLAVLALAFGSLQSVAAWPWVMGGTVLYLLLARLSVTRAVTRPGLRRGAAAAVSGAAAVAVFGALGLLVGWYEASRNVVISGSYAVLGDSADRAFLPVLAASLVLTMIAFASGRRLSRPESAVLAAVSGVTLLLGFDVFAQPTLLFDSSISRVAVLAVLTLAAVAWSASSRVGERAERFVFALALPFLTMALGAVFVADALQHAAVAPAAGILGVLAAAAVALLLTRFGRLSDALTLCVQIAAGTAGVVALAWLLSVPRDPAWITWVGLLALAVVTLLLAGSAGDPLTGRHASRHIAWVGLPLAAGSLWLALSSHDVGAVEWYTLPVAALLACLTALVAWRRGETQAAQGRTILAVSALVLAAAPSVLSSVDGPLERPLITLTAGTLVALTGLLAPHDHRGLRLRLLLTAAGTVAVVVTGVLRARTYVDQLGLAGLALDAWAAAGALLCALVAVVWARRADTPVWIGRVAVLLGVVSLALIEGFAVVANELPLGRALGTSALLIVLGLVAVVIDDDPLTNRMNHAVAVVLAVFCATALIAQTVAPFEVLTAPVGILLVLSGLVRLDSRESATTMTQLGLGIGVLLVPTLLADFAAPPLWRVVSLGILSLAFVVLGVVKRWRAPLLFGASVLAVHAVVQLWPWIRAVYGATGWWLWLGIGGVILIVLAATYERRLQNVRSLGETLRSYR